jgi:hypothetical protein
MSLIMRNIILFISLLILPIEGINAQTVTSPVSPYQHAAEELDSIIAEAPKLDDTLASITVRSRAAALLSFRDFARAEAMFLEVWAFAHQNLDEGAPRDRALTIVLKHLFPRHSKLAKRLLREEIQVGDLSLTARASGRDPDLRTLARLSSELVDVNPAVAAILLEQSLSVGVTPAAITSLSGLRERDPLLSDVVVAKVLGNIDTVPTVVSLSGLYLLSSYVFPESYSFSANPQVESSLESLQFQYFSTSYDVLRNSFAESEALLRKNPQYTDADLRFRAIYQAQMAMVLAALAPRYQTSLSPELTMLAQKVSGQIPAQVAQTAQFTAARLSGNTQRSENPEISISLALTKGDFQEAGSQIEKLKNDDLRKSYSQLLLRVHAKSLLTKSQLPDALSIIRRIEDPSARLLLYTETAKVAQTKRDSSVLKSVITEALTLVPATGRNGLHVRALLSFTSQLTFVELAGEAQELLHGVVIAINTLPKKSDEPEATKSLSELAWAQVNDPRGLIDTQELSNAFSSMGVQDLYLTLIEARKLEDRSVQLVARLEAIKEVIKAEARKPKTANRSPASTTRN